MSVLSIHFGYVVKESGAGGIIPLVALSLEALEAKARNYGARLRRYDWYSCATDLRDEDLEAIEEAGQ